MHIVNKWRIFRNIVLLRSVRLLFSQGYKLKHIPYKKPSRHDAMNIPSASLNMETVCQGLEEEVVYITRGLETRGETRDVLE